MQSGGPLPSFSGSLPKSLVYPFRVALAPRLGVALRLPKQTVLRGGLRDELHGRPVRRVCLDHGAAADGDSAVVCERADQRSRASRDEFTLANGFPSIPTAVTPGTYAVDPHYRLPYVQAYNLDVQKIAAAGAWC